MQFKVYYVRIFIFSHFYLDPGAPQYQVSCSDPNLSQFGIKMLNGAIAGCVYWDVLFSASYLGPDYYCEVFCLHLAGGVSWACSSDGFHGD